MLAKFGFLFSSTRPKIEQNQLKMSRKQSERLEKRQQHKIERLMISVKRCTTHAEPNIRTSFAMNGRKQTESIDWKIRELMILIASVHDFNFFRSRCPCTSIEKNAWENRNLSTRELLVNFSNKIYMLLPFSFLFFMLLLMLISTPQTNIYLVLPTNICCSSSRKEKK